MQKAARRRPSAGANPSYFIAPDEELIAAEAAVFAELAASIADVAAEEAAIDAPAADEAPVSGVVTTVLEVDGVDIVAGGVVVVVVDSSFLLQAAKDTAAARVTINSAVFMFLLDFEVRSITVIVGTHVQDEPHHVQDMECSSISSAWS
jgi:hypothetical protein